MPEKHQDVIVGADTHKHFHVITVVSKFGERLAFQHFDANAQGYAQAFEWACSFGTVLRAGVESTGSYGAGLCSYFKDKSIEVLDVYKPDKQARRLRGKNDIEDSFQAAEAALSRNRCAIAKDKCAQLEAARLIEGTYEQAVRHRTAAMNLLRANITTLPAKMRDRLENMSRSELIKTCCNFRVSATLSPEDGIKLALRSCAKRIQALDKETADLEKQIECYAKKLAPQTLSLLGIGCHGAIRLLCTVGKNIERIKSEAAFSMLCGVSPIPASSGDKIHLRLNPGGDRKANCVLHTMALSRIRTCEKTQAFIERKTSGRKTKKDAIRALKRYLAREVFCVLKADLASWEFAA